MKAPHCGVSMEETNPPLFLCLAKLIPASYLTCLLTSWFDLNFPVVHLHIPESSIDVLIRS